MELWLIVIVSLAVGAALGFVAARFLLPRMDEQRAQRQAQRELDRYREEVADHFARTAALVNQMTDSYKDVFDHLQQGAHRLLDEEQLRSKLAVDSGKTITLNRLGYQQTSQTTPRVPPDPGTHEESDEAERK